tara:strand:- start:16346 stop:16495 length:150 start_codon:yes stop_codon:yes gene_type:complete
VKRRPTRSSYRKVGKNLVPFDREMSVGKYSKGKKPKKKKNKKKKTYAKQ